MAGKIKREFSCNPFSPVPASGLVSRFSPGAADLADNYFSGYNTALTLASPVLRLNPTTMNLNNLTSFASEAASPSSSSKNILAGDVEILGTLKFENELIFDGKLDGEIISEGILTLGKNAHVKGEIKTKAVTVHGTVNGNITVSERCELKASSQLNGDLKAMRIVIEEGATFIGKSEVTSSKSSQTSTRSVTPASESPRGKSVESAA